MQPTMPLSFSDPLELLNADEAVVALYGHGVDHLIGAVHLPCGPGAFLSGLLGLLNSDKLATLKFNHCLHLASIRCCLFKFLTKLKQKKRIL